MLHMDKVDPASTVSIVDLPTLLILRHVRFRVQCCPFHMTVASPGNSIFRARGFEK